MVEELSRKSRIKKPRIGIASLPIPNAFAYGSPLAGNHVAVTTGLLKELETEEIEAVIGHEIGHLKHRDVQVMMLVSVLPAIFYWIYYSLFWTSVSGRQRSATAGLIAIISLIMYWILSLFTLQLSRLREYFADRHNVSIVKEGPRKLSEALAKIVTSSGRTEARHVETTREIGSFKTLLISDLDHAARDVADLSHWRTTDERLV